MTLSKNKIYLYNGIIFLILFLKFIVSYNTGLFEDEAIYWNWSQSVDASYSLITVAFIRLFTVLFGSSEIAVRLPALLSNFVLIFFIIKTGKLLNAAREIVYITVITFLSIPFVSIYTGFISPDTFLLTFSMISTYYFLKSVKYDSLSDWVLSGFFIGLMILSKYTASIFLLATAGSLILIYKKIPRNFYFSILTALIISSPLIIWNIIYDPVWFKYYILTNADKIDSGFINLLFSFLLSQISILMPFGFVLMLILLTGLFRKNTASPEIKFIKYISLFLIICFISFALEGKIKGNWFFIIYIPLIMMMLTTGLNKFKKFVITSTVIFNFILLFVINLPSDEIESISDNKISELVNNTFQYYWPDHKSNVHNDKNWTDRIIKMKKWKKTIAEVESSIKNSGRKYDFIASNDFNLSPLLEYYFIEGADVYLIGDLRFKYINSAESISGLKGKDALVITYTGSPDNMLNNKFEYIENLENVKIEMTKNIHKEFEIIYGKSFLPELTTIQK